MDLVQELKKIPPITRFLCGSYVGISLSVFAGLVSGYRIPFIWNMIWKKFEIWRLYTSFFLGPQQIAFFFELGAIYQSANMLETGSYHLRTAELAWQLLFAAAGIIAVTRPLNAVIFTKPLVGCLAYLASSLAPPGAQTSVMGLFTLSIKYWPYIMITIDLIIGGTMPALYTISGCIVGHVWWWAIWGGSLGSRGRFAHLGAAPEWVRRLVGEDRLPPPHPPQGGEAAGLRAAGIEVVAPRRVSANTTGYNWGSGQRLGR